MPTKINKKITSWKVKDSIVEQVVTPEVQPLESLHEKTKRPESLIGSTYQIKPTGTEHALYITINDYILNKGTPHECRHPYEIFINSTHMEYYQWVTALTRVTSLLLKTISNVDILVSELKGVFDPKGGYYRPMKGQNGIFMPSIVAEIGHVLGKHLEVIGLSEPEDNSAQEEYLAAKKKEYLDSLKKKESEDSSKDMEIPGARTCASCNNKTAVLMDGCLTCLSCAFSKCG